jgi:hypothetical protein
LGFLGSFIPAHQQLGTNWLLACIPTFAQHVKFLVLSQRRTPLFPELTRHSLTDRLHAVHVFGQDPNLDL